MYIVWMTDGCLLCRLFFGVPRRQPNQSPHYCQDFKKTQAGKQGQRQSIPYQGNELPHRLKNRPQHEHVFCDAESNRIHHANEEKENHLTQRHTVPDVISSVKNRADHNGWYQTKTFFEPEQYPASPENGFEETNRQRQCD